MKATRPPHASARLQPPGRFVFAALVLTLGLAVLLGVNTLITARYHRSVAEGVLRDYAGFAATELEARVQSALAQRIFPVLTVLAAGGADGPNGPLAVPANLAARIDTSVWRLVREDLALFRMVPGRPLELTGIPVSGPVRSLLGDSLPARAAAVLTPRAYFTLLWLPGPEPRRVAALNATRSSDGTIRAVYGFVVPDQVLSGFLAPALARAPLLPPSLTGGTRLDSAVTYRILRPDGSPLVASAALAASPYAARRVLEPMWGGLRIDVALRPSLAPRLVIGGVPRSRLPVVLVLLALTAVLVVTAVVQLRREREFARRREEFVAGTSHEFRTPLAQIRLFAETLRLGRVRNDAERERSLAIIDQATRRLSHLVENLLYASRIGRGMPTLTPAVCDLAAELREVVEGFGPIAASREVTVTVEAPARLDATADGDAFHQVVLNLLDNAVKYGPPGQTVTVRLERRDGQFRLTVEDQGPGVPAGERLRVFERFVRLERDREAHTGGAGLGLALVQELARLHGGSAWVEAADDRGARFVVEFPAGAES